MYIRSVALALLLTLFTPACSFDEKNDSGGGIRVRFKSPRRGFALSSFNSLSILSQGNPNGPVVDFGTGACFQVSVTGGAAGSSSDCDGEVSIGISSDVVSSIHDEIEIDVPTGEALTFTAYALDDHGGCSSLDFALSDTSSTSDQFFKVGEVSVGDDIPDVVELPVEIGKSSQGLNCGSGPYQVFGEDFSDFPDGVFTANSDWTPSGTVAALSGALDLDAFGPAANFLLFNRAVDRTRSIRLSADMTYAGISGGTPEIVMGITSSGGAVNFGCRFQYVTGAPNTIAIGPGFAATRSLSATSAGVAQNVAAGTNHKLVCVITTNGISVSVTGRVFDTNGTQLVIDETQSAAEDLTAVTPYLYYDGTANIFTPGNFVTSFLIEQAKGTSL